MTVHRAEVVSVVALKVEKECSSWGHQFLLGSVCGGFVTLDANDNHPQTRK